MTTKDFIANLEAFRKSNSKPAGALLIWMIGFLPASLASLDVPELDADLGMLPLIITIIWFVGMMAVCWIYVGVTKKVF